MKPLVSGLLLVLTLTGCALFELPRGAHPVTVTEEDFNGYYEDMASRVRKWYNEQGYEFPTLDSPSTLFAEARWFEFEASPGTTCYFRKPNSLDIGDDKWQSSCVAHELGHFALYRAGDGHWCSFEHRGESERRCE